LGLELVEEFLLPRNQRLMDDFFWIDACPNDYASLGSQRFATSAIAKIVQVVRRIAVSARKEPT